MAYYPYLLASTDSDSAPFAFFDPYTLDQLPLPVGNEILTGFTGRCGAVSPSGTHIALGFGDNQIRCYTTDGFLNAFTNVGGSRLTSSSVNSIVWLPGAEPRLFVTQSAFPYIELLEHSGGSWTDVFPGSIIAANTPCSALSPDGSLLAVGATSSPFLRVYNTSDWSTVTVTGGNPPATVNALKFSPDGSRLAVGHSTSPFLTVYNTSTWAKVTLTGGNPPSAGNSVAFSPSGARLIVGANTPQPYIAVYNTSTWTRRTVPNSLYSATGHLAAGFTSDGTYYFFARGFSAPRLIMRGTATDTEYAAPSNDLTSTVTSFVFLKEFPTAEGFLATQFGEDVVGVGTQLVEPQSWQATSFGSPVGYANANVDATGSILSTYGTVTALNAHRPTASKITAFGLAATPTYQVTQAWPFFSSRAAFGTPRVRAALTIAPNLRICGARSIPRGGFGQTYLVRNESVGAEGFSQTSYAQPRLSLRAFPTGATETAFGTPIISLRGFANSEAYTSFGAHAAKPHYVVEGMLRTKYNTPKARVARLYITRGWGPVFGTPSVLDGSLLAPESFSTLNFGLPESYFRHTTKTVRVASRFGKPTVLWG